MERLDTLKRWSTKVVIVAGAMALAGCGLLDNESHTTSYVAVECLEDEDVIEASEVPDVLSPSLIDVTCVSSSGEKYQPLSLTEVDEKPSSQDVVTVETVYKDRSSGSSIAPPRIVLDIDNGRVIVSFVSNDPDDNNLKVSTG